jgi:hypothetical protein
MPSTPAMASSIGVATELSIVKASAPTKFVVTTISGGLIGGNCAIGRRPATITPPSAMRIAMTIAVTGRLMKNLDIWVSVRAIVDVSRFSARRKAAAYRAQGAACLPAAPFAVPG